MRIAVIGGGPGGLYFSALAKQLDPAHEITVWERNAHDDTFGFGVVFSDETLGGIEHADPAVFAAMQREFARWDDIDVHFAGQTFTSGGHSFAALARVRLLQILQQRCADLGVVTQFRAEAPPLDELTATYDLVVASDGVNSPVRARYAEEFGTTLDVRRCKYMWLGTDLVFEAFKFYIEQTPHGVMQIHGYPYGATGSTFIVEMADDVWWAAGFDAVDASTLAPGQNDEAAIVKVTELFADVLNGHKVVGNGSKWISFTTVRNAKWRKDNLVLIGDAAHTAHFSIGSGTKLAMEDALALAACLHEEGSVDAGLTAYEVERRPVVQSTQRAAQASLEWFENLGQYTHQDPALFAFNILTRSRRVTHDNLRVRDPEFVAEMDKAYARDIGAQEVRPPMFQPFTLRGLTLHNRIVISPMDMYVSVDGFPTDFHLLHLGGKALGGAGLVMTEMVCVSAPGRITPGCTGMYEQGHEVAWQRIVDAVHEQSSAAIGIQLGHSGRKGSTRLMWEGIDEPLEDADANWPLVAPSALPYKAGVNQIPRELTVEEMAEIHKQFVASAMAADRAGFDLLELHCAHGYLLSSFISPITNQRIDDYGGSLENRLRYPLEVFTAIREVWPDDKPMTVRISATDWIEGGITGADSVQIAQAFADAGADAIDVSTGQIAPEEKPDFGRSYQTPFADAIRNKVGIATIAVGVISSWDDVNSLLLAGRADLCAVGRAHLYDPNWTLHAAIEQGYDGPGAPWPLPWKAGARAPQTGRSDGPKPRLQLAREGSPETGHARWRPNRNDTAAFD